MLPVAVIILAILIVPDFSMLLNGFEPQGSAQLKDDFIPFLCAMERASIRAELNLTKLLSFKSKERHLSVSLASQIYEYLVRMTEAQL